jgi:SsrA-binding protein
LKETRSGSEQGEKAEKNVCLNRRARYEYFIMGSFEAGIALEGSEVKSIRQGKVSLQDAYALIDEGEAYVMNMHVAPYEKAVHFLPDSRRPRKLLLHKAEIRRLVGRVSEKGLTLIPLRVYFVKGRVKLEIALARGKAKRDRREDIARRDAEREMRRDAAGSK